MKLPVRFPSEREKWAREVLRYREASTEERFRALFELAALCESFLAGSPHRERQLELLDQEEELEHRRWRELLKRHAAQAALRDEPL